MSAVLTSEFVLILGSGLAETNLMNCCFSGVLENDDEVGEEDLLLLLLLMLTVEVEVVIILVAREPCGTA